MKQHLITLVAAAGLAVATSQAMAAGEAPLAPAQRWSHSGMFGTFERGDLHRGMQVYREVCHGCHSLDLVAFRNLGLIGFAEGDVQAIAGEYEVEDGPDDDGEMFLRPAKPSDRWPGPFPNDQAARAANGGALPPDLSLIVKARAGESIFKGTKLREYGSDYLYALLTGYREDPPHDVELMPGMYYNDYFPGHQIAMAPPLNDGAIEYADGTAATVEQQARDVATFLAWAGDPNAEARRNMGIKVLLFLVVLTALLFALKRKIWADVHH